MVLIVRGLIVCRLLNSALERNSERWSLGGIGECGFMAKMGSDHALRRRFGQRIRSLRRERGYSQERFAALSGLDRSYMGSVERGERNIGIDNIGAIARALHVDVRVLFQFDLEAQEQKRSRPPEGPA